MPRARAAHTWNRKWAARGALSMAPLGALTALVLALIVFRQPTPALIAYAAGGAGSAVVGLVLGGAFGALAGSTRSNGRRQQRGQAARRARPWIRHMATSG